jgi:hypothetical protein
MIVRVMPILVDVGVDPSLQSWVELQSEFAGGVLLLGNGSSRAIWADFGYSSLYEQAQTEIEHPLQPEDEALFSSLETTNFEAVLSALRTAEIVCRSIGLGTDAIRMRHDSIRVALMEAIQRIHIPWDSIPDPVLAQVRGVLSRYSYVFTTNYDLLAYWAIMSEEDPWPFKDYFWNACSDGGSWMCFDVSNTEAALGSTKLLYLHGALHLVELPWGETAKLTAGDANLLEQFAVPDPDEDYPIVPLVITEGSSEDKMAAIRRSDYLSFAYERLSHVPGPLTIFGHSLSDEDRHLVDAVTKADEKRPLAVSVRASGGDQLVKRKLELMKTFTKADLRFFDAASHPLGSQEISVS